MSYPLSPDGGIDLSPHQRIQKFKKVSRPQAKTKGIVCIPTVVEVKKQSSTNTWTAPQIILDEGWTIYFGDEIGIISSSPSHIHIRKMMDGDVGIALKKDLFEHLLHGMLELKKHV